MKGCTGVFCTLTVVVAVWSKYWPFPEIWTGTLNCAVPPGASGADGGATAPIVTLAPGNACVKRVTHCVICCASQSGWAGLPVTVSVVCPTIVPALKATRMLTSALAPFASVTCSTSLPVACDAVIVRLVPAGSAATVTSRRSSVNCSGAAAPVTVTTLCCAGLRLTLVVERVSGAPGEAEGDVTGDATGEGGATGEADAAGAGVNWASAAASRGANISAILRQAQDDISFDRLRMTFPSTSSG